MSLSSDGEEICEIDTSEGFTEVQFLFRAYLMPVTYLFGIIANFINVVVFSRKEMRSLLVNWFFLALSLSDILVLFASFFVFSLPVYAEYSADADHLRWSAQLIVVFYPVAQTVHTLSVYLTVFVSVHRYLGVCHPFLIRRISNEGVVRAVILFAVVFALTFNATRWFELTYIPCKSKTNNEDSLLVIPTDFMMSQVYTYAYRNIAYTTVMFFLPFGTLIIVNVRIVNALRNSHQLRRQMTLNQRPCKNRTPSVTPSEAATYVIQRDEKTVTKQMSPAITERREHGVTIMLIAITTEFLTFNLLAFANNILELSGATSGTSQLETILVEVSALLVNINGASTIVIYLIFGTRYRTIFLSLLRDYGIPLSRENSSRHTIIPCNFATKANETESNTRKNSRHASLSANNNRRKSSAPRNVTYRLPDNGEKRKESCAEKQLMFVDV